MPEYVVSFTNPRRNSMDLPAALLVDGGRYVVSTESDGSVNILGNRNGLLYLAEVLVRCAIGGHGVGFHVHLPLDSSVDGPNVDARPELTIYGADEGIGSR